MMADFFLQNKLNLYSIAYVHTFLQEEDVDNNFLQEEAAGKIFVMGLCSEQVENLITWKSNSLRGSGFFEFFVGKYPLGGFICKI
jgi:hypothetical protein